MKKIFWAGLIVLVWVSTAFADGDSRKATDSEKQFTLQVLKIFETALPGCPDGWQTVENTSITAPEYVSQGQENFPMGVEYFIKWQDTARIDAAKPDIDQQLLNMGEKMKSDDGIKNSMDEMQKLADELGKAFQANDMEKIKALQEKMEAIGKKVNEQSSANEEDLNRKIRDVTPHDVEFKVNLNANLFDLSLPQLPTEQGDFDGYKMIRIDDKDQTGPGWHEGTTYLFMGDFKYVSEDSWAYMKAEMAHNIPYKTVQTVVIRITGDKNRAQNFLKQMNLKSIKTLMEK